MLCPAELPGRADPYYSAQQWYYLSMSKKTDWHKEKFPGQHADEEVESVFHQHPIVMRKFLLISLIVLTISAIPLSFWPLSNWPWWTLLGGFILAILIFLYRYISWHYSIFIISNERLIQIRQKGFFDRRVTDISHSKIQSVNYEVKGFQATLFHYGTIFVQSYVGEIKLRFIHKPEDTHQLLVKMVRTVRSESPANQTGGDVDGQIEES